jgi:hypothetical protein
VLNTVVNMGAGGYMLRDFRYNQPMIDYNRLLTVNM